MSELRQIIVVLAKAMSVLQDKVPDCAAPEIRYGDRLGGYSYQLPDDVFAGRRDVTATAADAGRH